MLKKYFAALTALWLAAAGPALAAEADLSRFDGGAETELALRQLDSGAAVSTAAPAAQPAAETDGIKLVRRFEPAPAYNIKYLNVLEIDPAKVTVKTVSARKLLRKDLATVPEFAAALPASLAVINASFFNTVSTAAPGTPLFGGYFVEDGERQPDGGSQRRVFYVTKAGVPAVAMLDALTGTGDIWSAAAGYGAGSKIDPTARTEVCLTAAGRLKFIGAYPVRTLDLMTEYLKAAEGCAAYVHLDGGGSAQMFYRNGAARLNTGWNRYDECYAGDTAMPAKCYRRVASVLVVLPRAD